MAVLKASEKLKLLAMGEYDATLYTADLSRNRRHPNCVIVCGGKRVILRQGEYEIIGGKEDG